MIWKRGCIWAAPFCREGMLANVDEESGGMFFVVLGRLKQGFFREKQEFMNICLVKSEKTYIFASR